MRTTLTIDDDVAALLEAERRRSGESLKSQINALLLAGLAAKRHAGPPKRFAVKPLAMDLGLGSRFAKASDLIEAMEGPDWR